MQKASLFTLALLALAACRAETLGQAESRAELAASLERDKGREVAARLAGELAAARHHLDQELSARGPSARARCMDDALARAPGQTTLVVRVRDARVERRELLPLAFSASLASDDFARVVGHFSAGRAALWDFEQARPKSPEDGESALTELAELRRRRYRAELMIEAFSPPRLFRRKDAPRSEWAKGALAGRLVIADLLEQRVLCQAPISVRGDATPEPVSRRLREATRARLLSTLNERVWIEMGRALASISSVLELPRPDARDAAQHRWARAPEDGAKLARAELD